MAAYVKQVIVLRTKYPDGRGGFFKPRLGKMAAQAAHASMKVFFDRCYSAGANHPCTFGPEKDWDWSVVKSWVEGTFTKVVVGCESAQELLDLQQRAQAMKLPCALIQDVGTTEFHGQATWTALAIGPALSEQLDPVTGHLKLL